MLDVSGRGRVDDRGMLNCQSVGCFGVRMNMSMGVLDCQGVGEWTTRACWTCQSEGCFGVRMDLSMGVLGHSELVGARDGYRNMKLFGRDESRTIHEAHPVKH